MHESVRKEIMRFDHIGIVVKNVEKAIELYSKFREEMELPKIEVVESQGVKITMFQENLIKIEFIEPVDNNSKVYNFLSKNSIGGLHHLCYKVEDIDETYRKYKNQMKCIMPKCIGHSGHFVAFFILRDTNCGFRLLELME